MDEKDWTGTFVERVRESAEIDFLERAEFLCADCESPIERVLYRAILSCPFIEGIQVLGRRREAVSLFTADVLIRTCPGIDIEYSGAFYAQVSLGPYRADFYMEAFDRETERKWLRIAIECDGHDFHEKTKQQAQRDKKRDRWFQARGIIVMRFTGAEIWRDPIACVDEIEETFFSAWKRFYRPERAHDD